MKIVQNYVEIILISASDSTYIFLLKIKILFGFATHPFYAESFLLSERFYIGLFMDIYSFSKKCKKKYFLHH